MTEPLATAPRQIGTGLLVKNGPVYEGDVLWFGFPIGVRITREGDGLRCEFYDRPKPDWSLVPGIDAGFDGDRVGEAATDAAP